MRILFIFCSFFTLCAQETAAFIAQFATSDTEGYLLCNDGTVWEVAAVQRRWRGPFEWWRDDKLGINGEYLYSVNDWGCSSDAAIYLKSESGIDEANVYNYDQIHRMTHILVNKDTQRVLFGYKLTFAAAMEASYAGGKKAGYNEGYNAGMLAEQVMQRFRVKNNASRLVP